MIDFIARRRHNVSPKRPFKRFFSNGQSFEEGLKVPRRKRFPRLVTQRKKERGVEPKYKKAKRGTGQP